MKNKIILIFSWICVLACMVMIFNFSSQDNDKSSDTSQIVIENILEIVMNKEDITSDIIIKYQLPVRKIAHFGIYMLLGFSLSCSYRITLKNNFCIAYFVSMVTAVLYAITDEFHQNFIDGRDPSIKDVLIDSGGAVIGILLYAFFFFLVEKRKKRKEKTPIT